MLFAEYNQASTYEHFLKHPAWKKALTWIQEHGKSLPDGEHEIQGRDIYANIQSLQTIPQPEGFFEVHQEYIDIHYCISGGEHIAYAPIGTVKESTALNVEKDYQLFYPTKDYSVCAMQPGSFAIFFPGELHMPKLQDGINPTIKKVVIKIKKSMIAS